MICLIEKYATVLDIENLPESPKCLGKEDDVKSTENAESVIEKAKWYDIIIVNYRVKSKRGTQFRIWTTGILKENMRKEDRSLP